MEKTLTRREQGKGAGLSLNLNETIDKWLSDVLGGWPSLVTTGPFDWQPRVDIKEDDKEYVISASVPGVDKKDINIEIRNHTLTIRGERREESEEKAKGYIRREQSYGSFFRSFELPDNVQADQIKAASKNGLLEIHLPKSSREQTKGKKINIE